MRDLNLPQESSELLASGLKGKNHLTTETKVTYYRNRDTEFSPFFSQNGGLLCCNDVEQVLIYLG